MVARAATGAVLHRFVGGVGRVYRRAFRPDGRRLAWAGNDTSVQLCDADTAEPLWQAKVRPGLVHNLVFSPDGRRLASGSEDGSWCLWTAADGTLEHPVIGHSVSV